jgi:WD40 repeat protein
MSFGSFVGPEGTQLLAGGPQNSVLLNRTALERMIVGHQGAVGSLAWAAGGAMLVSGGMDKSVRQWNVADGAQQRIYAGPTDAVTSVVVSHDGVTIFAAGVDKTIRAWPLADPSKQLYAVTLPAAVRSLRLSADSTRLYAAGDDNDVRMFDALTGRLIEQMPLKAASTALYVSSDESSLVSIGADNTLRRVKPSCTKLLAADPVKLHTLEPLPSDDAVAVSCEDKSIRVFDATGKNLKAVGGQPVAVTNLATAGDGKTLAAAGDAGASQPYVWAWDPNDGRQLPTLTAPAPVVAVAMSPQGRLAVSLNDRRVQIYEQGQLLEEFTLAAVASRLLYVSHESIVALVGDQNVHLLRPSCDQRFVGPQGPAHSAALSPDGTLLYTVGNEALLRVWDTSSGKQLSAAAMPTGAFQLRLSAKGEHVVVSTLDGKLLRWDSAAFKKEQADPANATIQLPIAARGLSVSPDGQRSVVGSEDGWLRVFDLTLGKELERHGPGVAIQALVWSPESGRVLSSSADKILARSRLGVTSALALSKESLLALAVSSDGLRQTTADASGKLMVSNVADGKPVLEQVLPSKVIHRLAWSPDGKELAIATGEGALLLAVPAKSK